MKFTIEQSKLVDVVNWVSRSLSSRPIQTALLGIVIDAEGNKVTLSGSDLETASRATTDADIATPGKVLVPGKLLADISRSLPNKLVTIQLDGTRVLVNAGSAKFTLPVLPINEYPNLPEMPEALGVIDADLFNEAVAQVATAAGKDDSLPSLTGVHVEVNGENITMAATDRYRLAVRELTFSPARPNTEAVALIRARTLHDAAKTLATAKNVNIALAPAASNDRLAGFQSETKSTTTRLLDGTFPPYRHLLPQESLTTTVIEVAPFLDAVRRVALVTDKTIPLKLTFTGNSVTLEAGGGDEAQANEVFEINKTGEDLSIAFNPNYLLDGLHAINAPFAQISFNTASKAAIIMGKKSADAPATDNFKYLLMPTKFAY
ncbi:MAG: DNA polymerase III subunit beta [Candidatus Nanopelagicaceae bacterium]|nr:DNA polymerase III subunit beta [Candidatus Nanopelagicaceae bacterium]